MNRLEKQNLVSQLSETFKANSSVLLVKFSEVNVSDETELRREISQADSCYQVVKNRLALLAAKDTSIEEIQEHFEGPTAIVYTNGDPVVLAKTIKKFIKDHPGMAFKAGLVEGRCISSEEVSNLVKIPSRAELLSKLLFLLSSPLNNLASALKSPVRGLVSLLGQLEGKPGEETPAKEEAPVEVAEAAEETPAKEEAPVEVAEAAEETPAKEEAPVEATEAAEETPAEEEAPVEATEAAEETPAEEEAPVEAAEAVEEGESLNQEVEEGEIKD